MNIKNFILVLVYLTTQRDRNKIFNFIPEPFTRQFCQFNNLDIE